MKKSFLILSSLVLLVLGVLSLRPEFAEKSQYLDTAVIAIAAFVCILSLTLKTTVAVVPAPAVVEPEPTPVEPEIRQPDLQAIPEQSAEVQVAQLLSLLQEKGRFLDFVMDDIKSYPDAQIAAAARVVHQGCQSVMQKNFTLESIASVAENQSITLAADYERGDYRLSGQLTGEPPVTGIVTHKGWKTTAVSLPKVMGARATATGTHVLAPAAVEVR